MEMSWELIDPIAHIIPTPKFPEMRHFGWRIPRMNPLILGGEIREIEPKNPMDMDESPDVLGSKHLWEIQR